MLTSRGLVFYYLTDDGPFSVSEVLVECCDLSLDAWVVYVVCDPLVACLFTLDLILILVLMCVDSFSFGTS